MTLETQNLGGKSTSAPIKINYTMTYDKGNVKVDKGQYQMLEVKVIYLEYIKLNLAYAISVVNQFMHDLR